MLKVFRRSISFIGTRSKGFHGRGNSLTRKLGSGKATNFTKAVPSAQLGFNIQNCICLSCLTMLVVYAIITTRLLIFHFRGWGCGSHHECKALRFTPEFRHLVPTAFRWTLFFPHTTHTAYRLPNRPMKCKRLSRKPTKHTKGNKEKQEVYFLHPWSTSLVIPRITVSST